MRKRIDNVYRYIIIEGKKPIIEQVNMIESLFSEFMVITSITHDDYHVFITYEQEIDISFLDVILNISSDIFNDLRIYVSHYLDDLDRFKHQAYVLSKMKDIPFNKYVYIDDKVLLKTHLDVIDDELKRFILKKYAQDTLMHETIKGYLECNQNMVLAAKKLYVHRNTLIQRIEKFYQVTGFDIRQFQDAYLIYHFVK